MFNLSVEYKETVKLCPHITNARTHSKKQIKQIARSIEQFGFVNPILVDKNSTVVAGHGRLEAAKLLDIKTVPTICLEALTPEQVRAYMLADNKLAELAGWDKEILKIEFENLISIDPSFDLTVTGFEMAEIDLIILDVEDNGGDKEDNLQEFVSANAISKKGYIWILGEHRIICGNALEQADYELLMIKDKAQMCFTDPPYNVKVDGHICGNGKVKHAEFAMASGEMTQSEFIGFLKATCKNITDYSEDGAISFVCMDWRHISDLIIAGNESFSELKNICVWAKDNGGMGSLYRSQHEFVAVFKNGTAPHINNIQLGKYGRYRTNVWNYAGQNTFHKERENDLADHPTVKPIELVADAILDCSKRGGIILDPFGGSGTTLLAAEKTGRIARLIELEPVYVDVTIRRWQKLTGKDAVHIESGKTFNEMSLEINYV